MLKRDAKDALRGGPLARQRERSMRLFWLEEYQFKLRPRLRTHRFQTPGQLKEWIHTSTREAMSFRLPISLEYHGALKISWPSRSTCFRTPRSAMEASWSSRGIWVIPRANGSKKKATWERSFSSSRRTGFISLNKEGNYHLGGRESTPSKAKWIPMWTKSSERCSQSIS